jgi:hypothetical protein
VQGILFFPLARDARETWILAFDPDILDYYFSSGFDVFGGEMMRDVLTSPLPKNNNMSCSPY